MASVGCSSLAGTALRPQHATPKVARAATLRCQAGAAEQRKVLGVGAALLAAASISFVPAARADIVAELKEKSESNKELNNRKRLATSYANLAQTRTVADGTCTFPYNLFGCDEPRVAGRVKYITEDREIECKGKPDGKCANKFQAAKVSSAFTGSPPQQ